MTSTAKKQKSFTLKQKLVFLFHLLTWTLLFLANRYFLQFFLPVNEVVLHTTVYILFIASIFYFHTYYIIPRFFKKNRVWAYFLIVLALLFTAAIANKYYSNYFEISIDKLNHNHHPRRDGTIRFIFSGTMFALIISAVLGLIHKFKQQEIDREELQIQKTSAELNMLKNQVNPHFLFNTLNNIYALSLDKSDPTVSEMILSLSEITRYMIYETEPEFVAIEKEIFYLNSYLELEKLRCEKTDNITVSLSHNNDLKIAPLILIPFIENAFKHSRIADEDNSFIKINLSTQGNTISFECENSIPKQTFVKDNTSGIGLENVQKRLALIYPNKHNLTISNSNNRYTVILKIEIK